MALFDNKLFDRLGEGELPEVKVKLEESSILSLAISVLVVSIIVMMINYLVVKH